MTEINEGMRKYIQEAHEWLEKRKEYRKKIRSLKFDTIAVHGMYSVEEAIQGGQGGILEPIISSSAQTYRDSDELEAAQAYLIPAWTYSRIHNPTVGYLEETISLLEAYGCSFDASALAAASGMAAIKQAVEPLVARTGERDDNINLVSSAQVYGGTFQLFNVRMKERGVQVRWVTKPWEIDEWKKLVDDDTRFIYGEMPSNPKQACLDVSAVAQIAHAHQIPFIMDSTIATPALFRPMEYGADIVVHSLTKTVGSSGSAIGGAFIARHDLVSKFLSEEQKKDYAVWVKGWSARDSGACMTPQNAYYFLSEIRLLRVKMHYFSVNAMKVAQFLAQHSKIERVDYLGLPEHTLHHLAKKYLKIVDSNESAFGHLMSFVIKGTPQGARKFLDSLRIAIRATDLGRIKSLAIIPAISTHLQQGAEGRRLAGIPDTLVRLCVGGENPDDLIQDLDQALSTVK
jgi:O-acetylhomoserine/O-acetylserine sulfhydrylase-like pyridoxal-dependent enzyme